MTLKLFEIISQFLRNRKNLEKLKPLFKRIYSTGVKQWMKTKERGSNKNQNYSPI